MKTVIVFILSYFFSLGISAQAPQTFTYQAVVRNALGQVLNDRDVSFRVSILSSSASGPVIYRGVHREVHTDEFGLVDILIGSGVPEAGDFSTIPWGSSSHFVMMECDPEGGSAWQMLSTMQLLSVPYALYANDVKNKDDADANPLNELQKISLFGNVLTLDQEGGSVILPSSGEGDDWGDQVVMTNTTLSGNGTVTSPLDIADNGITVDKLPPGATATTYLRGDGMWTLP